MIAQPVIKGKKVKLQPFTMLDINSAYLGWLNDPEVVRFSNQRFVQHNEQSCKQYFSSFEGSQNLFLSIRRLVDDQQIGTMTAYISSHHRTADIGIMVGEKKVWGLGFGLDAWDTLIHWLFGMVGIRKITAGTLACNHGMVKLMERSGMQLEATRKHQEIVENELQDILCYARFFND